jgi:hypothetical protein
MIIPNIWKNKKKIQPPISDICVSQNRVYSANGKHDDIFFQTNPYGENATSG